MSVNPVPRELDKDDKDLVKEYLANGGKVTVGEPMKRTEEIDYKGTGFYGRKKTKKKD